MIVLLSRPGWSAPPDDPSEMLARAEALYYEAEFAKSVELLTRADEILRPQAGHLEEKISQDPDLWLWSHKRWKHEWQDEYMKLWVDTEPPKLRAGN